MNINKIVFVGEQRYVKVGAHRSDSTKLVLKSSDAESGAALAQAFNLETGNTWQGSKYWITEVEKAAFLAGMAAMAGALQSPVKALKPALCSECGCDTGGHWACCSLHPETAIPETVN